MWCGCWSVGLLCIQTRPSVTDHIHPSKLYFIKRLKIKAKWCLSPTPKDAAFNEAVSGLTWTVTIKPLKALSHFGWNVGRPTSLFFLWCRCLCIAGCLRSLVMDCKPWCKHTELLREPHPHIPPGNAPVLHAAHTLRSAFLSGSPPSSSG